MQQQDNANPSAAINILNIESMINNFSARFETLEKEYKENREMLNSILENDAEYQEIDKEAKKQSKLRTIAKQKVLKRPEAAQVAEKIKDYQIQMKEIKTALSDYLSQYVSLAGTNQIEGPDGILRQIIYTARLVAKKD